MKLADLRKPSIMDEKGWAGVAVTLSKLNNDQLKAAIFMDMGLSKEAEEDLRLDWKFKTHDFLVEKALEIAKETNFRGPKGQVYVDRKHIYWV